MGRKRKDVPGLQEALEKPWCYYCEREFNDLLNLSRHQKAKHFKCARCGRRLNTAGGLSVHLQQVHKETLQKVENALEHRQGLEVEIFGMEGIPQDLVDQRKQRVIREFEATAEAKRRLTGNPLPGMPVQHLPKINNESAEEMRDRFAKWKKDRAEGRLAAPTTVQGSQAEQPSDVFNQYGAGNTTFNGPPGGNFGQYPPQFQAGSLYGPAGSTPLHNGRRPGSPQTGEPPNKRPDADFASSLDNLIADASRAASGTPTAEASKAVPKPGKDKKREKIISGLVWKYENVSPEEVRAMHASYVFELKPYQVEIS